MEWIYWLYIPPGFQQLEALLKGEVLQAVAAFKANSVLYVSLFGVGFLVLIMTVWIPIWKKFREERLKLQKMFRIIPVNIIRGNTFVKNYLISNCDHVLDPIKNLL